LLDVAVIGGGPVGSRLAFQLASQGHTVTVLERHPAIGQKSCCTGIISQQCVEHFAISPRVIHRSLNSAVFYSPSEHRLSVSLPQPQAVIVDRLRFDCWLADQARSCGAQYLLNCNVTQVKPIANAVEIEFTQDQIAGKLKARVCVLACGFNSPLVKLQGLGQPGYQVAGVQASVETGCCDEVQVYFNQKISPGFFAWLAPTTPGHALVGLMSRESPGLHLRNWMGELAAKGQIKQSVYPLKYGGIPLKPLKNTVSNRILVVGDAAGQVKPTTGGGLYFGLLCADIAADTLHKAFNDQHFDEMALSSYERQWRQLLLSELNREYWARRAYQLLSNRQIDGLFKSAKNSGLVDSLIREYQSFDNHGNLLIKAIKLSLVSPAKRFTRYLSH
jgi:digeranylgeranylglycerophospholipid reductase